MGTSQSSESSHSHNHHIAANFVRNGRNLLQASSRRTTRAQRSSSVATSSRFAIDTSSIPANPLLSSPDSDLRGRKVGFFSLASGGNALKKQRPSFIRSTSNSREWTSALKHKWKQHRRSKSCKEHAKAFQDIVSAWCTPDLQKLVLEFESGLALRELATRSDLSRALSYSVHDDLGAFLQGSIIPDVHLIYCGRSFYAHRSILSNRCRFFARLLSGIVEGVSSTSSATQGPSDTPLVLTVNVPGPIYLNQIGESSIGTSIRSKFQTNSKEKSGGDAADVLSVDGFGALLRYLYTGDIQHELGLDVGQLLRLKNQFGSPHPFDYDLYSMWQNTIENNMAHQAMASSSSVTTNITECDCVLMFSAQAQQEQIAPSASIQSDGIGDSPYRASAGKSVDMNRSNSLNFQFYRDGKHFSKRSLRFACHSVVLAARSPFFRNLIERRLKSENDLTNQMEIVLDEAVIQRQYVPVVLHAMYTDKLDLSLVIAGCHAQYHSSLNEVQVIASGKSLLSPIHEATEIYQIAQFLEMSKLAQDCEDFISKVVSTDTLNSIFAWASEAHGSDFVRRQCVRFLAAHFSSVARTAIFFDLEESLLREVLKSDFVQASELEILQSVIRYGENILIKRIELREPNLLNGTTHSVSRKGVRRNELCDVELREILCRVFPYVRIPFVLPYSHPVVYSSFSRGLLSCSQPPLDMPANVTLPQQDAKLWLNFSTSVPTQRPRVFLPYYEEAKTLLAQRQLEPSLSCTASGHGVSRKSSSKVSKYTRVLRDGPLGVDMPDCAPNDKTGATSELPGPIPDALYMVDSFKQSVQSLDSVPAEVPVPELSVVLQMAKRVNYLLKSSTTAKKALRCGCWYHRKMVVRQLRLRVVREFGYLDSTVEVLENTTNYYPACNDQNLLVESGTLKLDDDDLATPLMESSIVSRSGPHDCMYMVQHDNNSSTNRKCRSEPRLDECLLSVNEPASCSNWPDLMLGSMSARSSNDVVVYFDTNNSQYSTLEREEVDDQSDRTKEDDLNISLTLSGLTDRISHLCGQSDNDSVESGGQFFEFTCPSKRNMTSSSNGDHSSSGSNNNNKALSSVDLHSVSKLDIGDN